jgi:Nucleotide-diphospho-sugar transferase
MKLYCVYSQQFVPLHQRFFEPSLRAVSPDIQVISDVFQVGGNGDFRSAGFNQALIYKWKRGLEALHDNPNQVILFTDMDMIFHKPLTPAILSVLGDADIAVTPEAPGDIRKCGVNVGVLALRSNSGVRQLVSRILDEMILRGEWDQRAFNILLPQSKLRWKLLPLTFANGRIPMTADSVLYHATCTVPVPAKTSLELKMEALSKAAKFFASNLAKSAPNANVWWSMNAGR